MTATCVVQTKTLPRSSAMVVASMAGSCGEQAHREALVAL